MLDLPSDQKAKKEKDSRLQDNTISVIVPVYNVASEIERCITSILAQTYSDIEIIAVDDGSTDGSANLLDTISCHYPKVKVIHQRNAGVTAARMAGIAAAKGEWIGFVDGDDYIEPDMYERLMANALKYHADISHCGYRMVFADGRVNYFHDTGRLAQQDKLTGLKELLDGSRIEPGLCNKLFHKRLFHSLLHSGVEDMGIRINEDLLMNYYLFHAAEKTVYEDFCPYHYIVRRNSASRSARNHHQIWDPIKVKEKILNMDIEGMEGAAWRAYLSTCVNVYNGLAQEHGKQWKKEKSEIRKLLTANRCKFRLLARKQRLLARMICWMPCIYPYLYRFYAKYFLVNRYI